MGKSPHSIILTTIASPPRLSIKPVRFALRCMTTPHAQRRLVSQLGLNAMAGKSGTACIPSRILHDPARGKRRSIARQMTEFRPAGDDIAHRHAFANDRWRILPN
jgi:hypothetical protein